MTITVKKHAMLDITFSNLTVSLYLLPNILSRIVVQVKDKIKALKTEFKAMEDNLLSGYRVSGKLIGVSGKLIELDYK